MRNAQALSRRSVLAAAGAVVAAPSLAFAKEKKPIALPTDQARLLAVITGSGKPVLSAGSTIHIPTFRVELVRQVSKTAETTGFAAAGRASQSSTYTLTNMDEAQVQLLTQGLYDELVANLRALGHTVATPDETRADKDLGPLMVGPPSPLFLPNGAGLSSFHAPSGLSVVIEPLDPSVISANPMAGFAGASAAMQRGQAVYRAVQRKQSVIQVKYSLTFADLASSTDGAFGRLTDVASVSASLGLKVLPESTRWDVTAPASNRNGLTGGHYLVDTMLSVPGAAFVDGGNAGGQGQAAMTANLLSLAMGSANTYGASARSVLPTPLFHATAQTALSTVQKGFLARVTTSPGR